MNMPSLTATNAGGTPVGANGQPTHRRVIVCAGTGCVASGAWEVYRAFNEQISAAGIPVTTEFKPETEGHGLAITKSGCQGFCQMGPLVTLLPENILYTRVKAADVAEIVAKTVVGGEVVERLLYVDPATDKVCRGVAEIPFYQRQQRFVLRECGLIDPENIHEFLRHGGYGAARKAFLEMTPEQICREIGQSGLRGRGGWRLSHRPQMGRGADAAEREKIRDLQRGRGRSRGLHEPQRDGGQPAQRDRGVDDCRARDWRR